MGGTVGMTIRQDDRTVHKMSRWTNSLPYFINDLGLIKKHKRHLNGYLKPWFDMVKDYDSGKKKLGMSEVMDESEYGYYKACKIENKNERQKVLRDTLDSIKKMLTDLQDKQNGEEEQRPKYLARKDDGAVWSLNNDGITYSHMEHKEKYPDNIHHKYSQETLLNCGFSPVIEEDFPKLQALGKEYYEYLSWSSRSDGHGGSKGGAIEEFRKYKSKLKK